MPPLCSSSSLKSYERVQGAEAAGVTFRNPPTRYSHPPIAGLFSSLFLILDVYILHGARAATVDGVHPIRVLEKCRAPSVIAMLYDE